MKARKSPKSSMRSKPPSSPTPRLLTVRCCTALPTSQAQTTPLPYPTPVAGPQGQRTLTPPTLTQSGRLAPNYPGGVRPATLLNQPIVPSGQPPLREVEIIAFNRSGAKPGAGNACKWRSGGAGFSGERESQAIFNTKVREWHGIDFITASSFVRVAMLNGIDAPTGGRRRATPCRWRFTCLMWQIYPTNTNLTSRTAGSLARHGGTCHPSAP